MEQEKANAALREECVSSRLIFDGRVVQLYVDRVRLPDGREAEREYMRHIGAVAFCRWTGTALSTASGSTAIRTARCCSRPCGQAGQQNGGSRLRRPA